MLDQMTPKEIKELLGVSRSAMRYYTEKGLISAKKNEWNGYSYYSGSDLLELIDVAFYRNCLDANAEDIRKLTFAGSVEEMQKNYKQQIDEYAKKIEEKKVMLDMLIDFCDQIDRALSNMDKIKKAYLRYPFYLYYPEGNDHVNIHAEHFQCSYWLGEFSLQQGKVLYRDSCNMIAVNYVGYLDKYFPSIKYKKVNGGTFLYSAFTSKKELNDPSLLDDMLQYAKEQNITVEEPVFTRYLLTLREEGERSHCYEGYIKIKE